MEPSAAPRPAFAHASEAEFARILDFYEVRWEYEPHTFPILWTLDGAVAESFSPDFWLPDLELYVEMTTLKQSLVRKKNRKLRRLRELYPDVRIKLFYGRDFRALMLKYGKLGLFGAMSGTLGQATPPNRPAGVVAAIADPALLDTLVAEAAVPDETAPAPLLAPAASTAPLEPIAPAAPTARRRRRAPARRAAAGTFVEDR
jgi:hypothetical protein